MGTQVELHVKLGMQLGSDDTSTGSTGALGTDVSLVLEAGTDLL